MFGLLGPNGAGKTTTIRVINTLLPVQQGAVAVFGLDVARDAMAVRRLLGYVPQQLSVEGALTGRRERRRWFARLFDVPRRERAARVDEALAAMDLLDAADRLAGTYSGGMIRRLELAQALVNGPRLLVLDEPTVGLDPIARDSVWERVARDARRARHDRAAHHPLHGGGRRALRPGRADAPRPPRAPSARPPSSRPTLGPTRRSRTSSATTPGDLADDGGKEGSAMSVAAARTARQPGLTPTAGPGALAPRAHRRALCLVELQKLRHDRTELLTRAIQPVLWLLIFGQTFSRMRAIPTGARALPRLPRARASSPSPRCSSRSSTASRSSGSATPACSPS